jgi:hypothetical protein
MLELGIAERVVAISAGVATHLALLFWVGWPVWLSAACGLCVFSLALIGMFLVAGALEVRNLKKRGLPMIDNWPDDAA